MLHLPSARYLPAFSPGANIPFGHSVGDRAVLVHDAQRAAVLRAYALKLDLSQLLVQDHELVAFVDSPKNVMNYHQLGICPHSRLVRNIPFGMAPLAMAPFVTTPLATALLWTVQMRSLINSKAHDRCKKCI